MKIRLLILAVVCLLFIPAGARAVNESDTSSPEPVPAQVIEDGTILTPLPEPEVTPEPEVEDEGQVIPRPDDCAYPCATNQTDPTDPYSNDVCNEWMMPNHGIYADQADNEAFADAKDEFCNIQSEEENQALIDEMCAEWAKPNHGSWGLDPGPITPDEQEYLDNIDGVCNPQSSDEDEPVLEEPEPEPTPEPTLDPVPEETTPDE